MKKKRLSLFRAVPLVLVSVALMFSCVFDAPREKEEEAPAAAELPLSERLSIDEARRMFEEAYGGFGLGTRGEGEGELPEPEILWGEALYTIFFENEIIEASIQNIKALMLDGVIAREAGLAIGDIVTPNTALHLICGTDSAGEVSYRIVHLVPGDAFLSGCGKSLSELRLSDTAENYTGEVHFYTLELEYVLGYIISEGALTHCLLTSEVAAELFGDEEREETDTSVFYGSSPNGGKPDETDDGTGNPEDHDGTATIETVTVKDVRPNRLDWLTLWWWPNPFGFDLSGGSGGTGGGGGNGNGNGGNNNDPDPEPEPEPQEEPEDPCENLRNKLGDEEYYDMLRDLMTTGVTYDYETGNFVTYDGTGFSIYDISGDTTFPGIDMKPGDLPDNLTSFIHTHYDGLWKTFTPEDIALPYILNLHGKLMNLGSFSMGLVTPDGVYYLFISNPSKYLGYWQYWNNQFNNIEIGFDLGLGKIHKEFVDRGIEKKDITDSESMRILLEVINSLDLGLTLMKMNDAGTGFSQMKINLLGNIRVINC